MSTPPAAAPVPTPSKHDNHLLMGILSYLGPLVVVPWFTSKEDPFVHTHVKQGAGLLIAHIAVWLLSSMMWRLWAILNILNLAIVILSIIGIVQVIQKKDKVLPVVGDFFAKLPL